MSGAVRTTLPTAVLAASMLARGATVCAQHDDAASLEREGRRAVESQRWNDAIASLERAVAAQERPASVRLLAQAYRGADRCLQAIETYRHLGDIATDNRTRAEAAAGVEALQACVAEVTVHVVGEDARLLVDGVDRHLAEGDHVVRVDPGQRVFEAARVGEEGVTVRRWLGHGERREMTLELPTSVVVDLEGGCRDARVDATPLPAGRGYMHTGPGIHVVEARCGAASQRQRVQASAGQRVRVRFVPQTTEPQGPAMVESPFDGDEHATGAVVTPHPSESPEEEWRRRRAGAITRQWWFWTLIGVGVAGAVTGGYFLFRGDPEVYQGTWGATRLP